MPRVLAAAGTVPDRLRTGLCIPGCRTRARAPGGWSCRPWDGPDRPSFRRRDRRRGSHCVPVLVHRLLLRGGRAAHHEQEGDAPAVRLRSAHARRKLLDRAPSAQRERLFPRSAGPLQLAGAGVGSPRNLQSPSRPERESPGNFKARGTARRMLEGAAGDNHGRPSADPGDRRVLRPLLGLRAALREALMNLEYGIGLALSVLLLVYLSWALVKPERF